MRTPTPGGIADDSKPFNTLAVQFALAGCELNREVDIDGVKRLHAVYHGKVAQLGDLGAARTYLRQIGGVA